MLRRMLFVVILACLARSALADDPGQLLLPFKQSLMKALQQGLQEGPVAAIEACQIQAPALAQAASTDGVIIGRSSHRLRNPDNAPADWLIPVMEDYLADASQAGPRTLVLEDGRQAYVEPIFTQPLCLNCHGSKLVPEVRAELHKRYPDDRAINFSVGELRGVFWLTRPVPEA